MEQTLALILQVMALSLITMALYAAVRSQPVPALAVSRSRRRRVQDRT